MELKEVPPLETELEPAEGDDVEGVRTGAEPLGAGAVEGDESEATPEPEPPRPPKPMQIPIPGTVQGISTDPGGSAPTVSEARLMGGSLPIDGEFEGEEFVELIVTAKVGEVDFVYTSDDWGNTKVVKRRHKMRMISVRRAGQ